MTTTTLTTTRRALDSGTSHIAGDLPVVRLGYGAMRLTGPRAWRPLGQPDYLRQQVDMLLPIPGAASVPHLDERVGDFDRAQASARTGGSA
jgi:hypothetical protein